MCHINKLFNFLKLLLSCFTYDFLLVQVEFDVIGQRNSKLGKLEKARKFRAFVDFPKIETFSSLCKNFISCKGKAIN